MRAGAVNFLGSNAGRSVLGSNYGWKYQGGENLGFTYEFTYLLHPKPPQTIKSGRLVFAIVKWNPCC